MSQSDSPQHDFYHEWLGIPPGPRPPDHYTLLAIERFHSDCSVIERAAMNRMKLVRARCIKFPDAGTRLLNELAAARVCLCDPESKLEYDRALAAGSSAPSPLSQNYGDDPAAIELGAHREIVEISGPSSALPQTLSQNDTNTDTQSAATSDDYEVVVESSDEQETPEAPYQAARPQPTERKAWGKSSRRRGESAGRQSQTKRIAAAALGGALLSFVVIRFMGGGNSSEPSAAIDSPAYRPPVPSHASDTATAQTTQPVLSTTDSEAPSSPGPDMPDHPDVGAVPRLPDADGTEPPPVSGAPPRAPASTAGSAGSPRSTAGSESPTGRTSVAAAKQATANSTRPPDSQPTAEPARPGRPATDPAPSAAEQPSSSVKQSNVIGAWTLSKPVSGISFTSPFALLNRVSEVAEAEIKTVEFEDDVRLTTGYYHLFQIAASGVTTVQWKGAATGNALVLLGVWDGARWVQTNLIKYSGALASCKATPPKGESTVFVLVHCTGGSIATDYVDGLSAQQTETKSELEPSMDVKSKSAASTRGDSRLQGDDNDWYVIWVRGQSQVRDSTSSKVTWESFHDVEIVHGKLAAADRLSAMLRTRAQGKVRNLIGQGKGFAGRAEAESHRARMDSGDK